jgi:hypothetical protein
MRCAVPQQFGGSIPMNSEHVLIVNDYDDHLFWDGHEWTRREVIWPADTPLPPDGHYIYLMPEDEVDEQK